MNTLQPPTTQPLQLLTTAKITTLTGNTIDVLNPTPQGFSTEDIAESLSKLCRFNGHCKFPWSVASHTLLGLILIRDYFLNHPQLELIIKQWLLHDATEAYIGDMIKPIKIHIDLFNEYEHVLWKNGIAPFFKVPPEFLKQVKEIDLMCFLEESTVLTNKTKTEQTELLKHYPNLKNYQPKYSNQIQEIPWQLVKKTFKEALDFFF